MASYFSGLPSVTSETHLLRFLRTAICSNRCYSLIDVPLPRGCDGRAIAEQLVQLAAEVCPRALDHRNVETRETLLMVALRDETGTQRVIDTLVRREPNQVHVKYDTSGKNAFHHAVGAADLESLRHLLNSLADRSVAEALSNIQLERSLLMTDNAGWTPLHYLAESNRAESLQLLHQFCLKRGLHLNLKVLGSARSGRLTPWEVAIECEAASVIEFLRQRHADRDDSDDEENAPEKDMARAA